jgi:NMD protein affecting ribosome stability and mRNA decay
MHEGRILCRFCVKMMKQSNGLGRGYGLCQGCGDKKPSHTLTDGLCKWCLLARQQQLSAPVEVTV